MDIDFVMQTATWMLGCVSAVLSVFVKGEWRADLQRWTIILMLLAIGLKL